MSLPRMTGPYHVEGDELATVIRGRCWNHDELLPNADDLWPLDHPLAGHCHIASESYMVLANRDLRPEYMSVEFGVPGPDGRLAQVSHWYLRDDETGEVVDLTAEQFTEYPHTDIEIAYDKGTPKDFDTTGDYGPQTAKVVEPIVESDRNDWEITV